MNRATTSLAAAAVALTLAACSSSDNSVDTTSTTPAQTASSAPNQTPTPTEKDAATRGGTPVTITADGKTISATLNDSQVSRDLLEMLPVTTSWFRNADIEYITELDAPLTETGPFYTGVQPGDLVYYNPEDSLTIIYEQTSSVPTLTKMGEITSNLDVFEGLPDNVEMRIAATPAEAAR